jgi:hypothetical protein
MIGEIVRDDWSLLKTHCTCVTIICKKPVFITLTAPYEAEGAKCIELHLLKRKSRFSITKSLAKSHVGLLTSTAHLPRLPVLHCSLENWATFSPPRKPWEKKKWSWKHVKRKGQTSDQFFHSVIQQILLVMCQALRMLTKVGTMSVLCTFSGRGRLIKTMENCVKLESQDRLRWHCKSTWQGHSTHCGVEGLRIMRSSHYLHGPDLPRIETEWKDCWDPDQKAVHFLEV